MVLLQADASVSLLSMKLVPFMNPHDFSRFAVFVAMLAMGKMKIACGDF
jgi:hypothetical protein